MIRVVLRSFELRRVTRFCRVVVALLVRLGVTISESLFLLPMAMTAGQTGAAAEAPTPCRNPAVLGSMENFSQWKEAKPHTAVTKDSEEENLVTLSDPVTALAIKQEKPAVSSDYTRLALDDHVLRHMALRACRRPASRSGGPRRRLHGPPS